MSADRSRVVTPVLIFLLLTLAIAGILRAELRWRFRWFQDKRGTAIVTDERGEDSLSGKHRRTEESGAVELARFHRLRAGVMPDRLLGTLALVVLLALAPFSVRAAEKLVICYGSAASALVPLASLRNFYATEGLDVEIRRFPSGKQALESMFAGDCTLATAARTPLAHYSLLRNDFLIIAAIAATYDLERIVVRSDRGILTPADLRGRRIAVPEFTTAHYFLDLYLLANNMAPKDVQSVFLTADAALSAFRRGEVDAVAHFEPNIQILADEFGARAKVFSAPGLHTSPFLLVGGRNYVHQHPAAIQGVLRALMRAERFVAEQPNDAKELIMRSYDAPKSEIDTIGPLHNFRVSLDQSLLFILENAARWELSLLPAAQRPALPNYLDFIYLDGLLAVKPDVVTIIH